MKTIKTNRNPILINLQKHNNVERLKRRLLFHSQDGDKHSRNRSYFNETGSNEILPYSRTAMSKQPPRPQQERNDSCARISNEYNDYLRNVVD